MSHITLPRVRRIAIVALGVAIAALMVATFYANRDSAQATHLPANKVWVSADTLEKMQEQTLPNGEGVSQQQDRVELGRARAKFSNPTDVRISVTAECALWTNTATFGDDDAETKARVELWVEIDGTVVPVSNVADPGANSSATTSDPDQQGVRGRVVFCNRASRMKTENIESTTVPPLQPNQQDPEDNDSEDDIVIRSYNRTRSANAFNWGAMNVGAAYDKPYNGNNVVDIVYYARLATSITDEDTQDNDGTDSPAAKAIVGKRTMYIEPVKMANDAAF